MLNLSFKGKRFKIVNKFYIFLAVSLAIIIAGAAVIIFKGLNVGIDFSAGATVEVTVNDFDNFKSDEFKAKYENWLKGDRDNDGTAENERQFTVSNTRISNAAGQTTFEFRIGSTVVEKGEKVDLSDIEKDESSDYYNKKLLVAYVDEVKNEIKTDIYAYLKATYPDEYPAIMDDTDMAEVIEINPHTIDNSVMLYTIKTAFVAAAVAIAVMLVYIMFRFTWISGIAAILALLHDVLVMVAFTAFFQIPVNSVFIAAVITIIGYSINATIIIFDKIREYLNTPSLDEENDTELANEAVTNTLTRSILTTITTLVVIALLAIFAPASIREFAYPIIFGLLAGAYSSVLLSASIWVNLRKLFKQSGKRPSSRKIKKRAVINEQ